MFQNTNSVNAREHIVKFTAEKTSVEESVVEKVINFEFKDVVEATKTSKSIEINGLCRFLVSPSKIKKRILILEKAIINAEARIVEGVNTQTLKNLQNKIKNATEVIKFLSEKLENED